MDLIGSWKKLNPIKKVFTVIIISCIVIFMMGFLNGNILNNKHVILKDENSINNSTINEVYKDGTYRVGFNLSAGKYKFIQTGSSDGNVKRAFDSSMEFGSIISNKVTSKKGSTIDITVNNGEYLKIQGGELVKV